MIEDRDYTPRDTVSIKIERARFLAILNAGLPVLEAQFHVEFADCDEGDPELKDAQETIRRARELIAYFTPLTAETRKARRQSGHLTSAYTARGNQANRQG